MLAGFVPVATTACFGKFRLVQKVYSFNKRVDPDPWIRWFVFLVLSVIPVYAVAFMIDTLLANSLEFWTGTNPITADAGTRKVVQGPNGETMTLTSLGQGVLDVTLVKDQRMLGHFTVRSEEKGLSAWDAQGQLLARVQDVAGMPSIVAGQLSPAAVH